MYVGALMLCLCQDALTAFWNRSYLLLSPACLILLLTHCSALEVCLADSRAVGTVSSASVAFKDPFKCEVLLQGLALLCRVCRPAGQLWEFELLHCGLESVCP